MSNILILHNIISPYKTLLFNALHEINRKIEVLYISKTESRRAWDVNTDTLEFPYRIMFNILADEISKVSLFKETIKHLNNMNPNVLIIDGYSYASSWAGLFWAKRNKKKIILWSSSNRDDHKRTFYKEYIKSLFVRSCDAYNVYGTKSKKYLICLGAREDRIFTTGNNTDNGFYYHETMKWSRERSALIKSFGMPERNFLYIGRFSPEKNIMRLLDAYRDLKRGSEWGLILLGRGPQKEDIERHIKTHQIKNVFMPGFKQKDEVPKYMAVSDIFVLPSISEPWGLVVNEAMAAGFPVLVSIKCGCSDDLIKSNENGFVFDPLDKDGLLKLMNKMTGKEIDLIKMGKQSLEIIKDFTPERATSTVLDTIDLVLKTQGQK